MGNRNEGNASCEAGMGQESRLSHTDFRKGCRKEIETGKVTEGVAVLGMTDLEIIVDQGARDYVVGCKCIRHGIDTRRKKFTEI